jgi:hypothetical protein
MSISVPGPNVLRRPPAAFVTISVSTPSVANVRTGNAAVAGECPS